MNRDSELPLVSVGVPSYNRPELLARALECLCNQTYRELEIIISDNASPDPRVAQVIGDYSAKDPRIRSFHQPRNFGPYNNFFFVLQKSTAEFFMWAADDDYLEPWFIQRCMDRLVSDSGVALATTEAQYVAEGDRKLLFVPEGEAFREPLRTDRARRVRHLIKNNYGNLVYGLFRKSALMQGSEVFWAKTARLSSNEVPPLLLAAVQGDIVVRPEIGLYKYVPEAVHAQVVWEVNGGWLPLTGRISGIRSLIQTWRYHWGAMRDIKSAIKLLSIPLQEMRGLIWLSRWNLFKHFIFMLICFKPRRAAEANR
jgi:glycosyltransferase involved in cell wall biosynthesis